jgi:cysteine desulfurase
MSRTYLDYNASAPLRPEAGAAMTAALAARGNASSVHTEGRAAHARLEQAREAVAALVGGEARLVTFTSGGTEANVTVLTPDWTHAGTPVHFRALIAGATEHPSVLAGGRFAAERVHRVAVDGDGVVRLDDLRRLLAAVEGPALVSVMAANNETGVIQPVAEIAGIAHAHGALVHSDAVQAAGRIAVDLAALGVDVLTLSAHKIGGPQGAGAIVRANADWTFAPLLTGGGQERRTRAGTENVAAVAGFGAAAQAAGAECTAAAARLAPLRDCLAAMVKTAKGAVVFAEGAARLPQTVCFAVPGIPAETLVIALDLAGVAVSSGAACSSGKVAPSPVLAAMGVPPELARCAIRLSLGWDSAEKDIDSFARAWASVLSRLSPGETQAA